MFSPKLRRVNKLPLKYILNNAFVVAIENEENNMFSVMQQMNPLFRQIDLITKKRDKYIPHIIFVDCSTGKGNKEGMSEIVINGFEFNGRQYVISERSASMVRQSILSFIDSEIASQLDEIVTMGTKVDKTVLSKYYAYRGLMLSSCHCLEGWKPKVIVVPDRHDTIKNQKIKYLVDSEIDFVDKEGNQRTWKQKDTEEGIKDVEINLFDGCGIHHPAITDEAMKYLSKLGDLGDMRCTSLLIRAPYIKGMTHEVDYISFFQEHGVEFIQDFWGVWHDVRPGSTPMMIITESMYKGLKYFKKSCDKNDWDRYWDAFIKYNHCIGIVSWNRSLEDEEVYRRGNYQILQDLELDYRDFRSLADYSAKWVEDIMGGDWCSTAAFLGLFANRCNPVSVYAKAIAKNPMMINEESVRTYLKNSLKKYIDEMKCGKIFLKATSKYFVPDLIMLMEHIGGLELQGCLEEGEIWSQNLQGDYEGEFLVERNPHIAHSEHAIMSAVSNESIDKYLRHLSNVVVVNSKSLIAQRLNGGDFDGDSVLLVDNKTMINGVNRNAPIVLDIEDKATTLEQGDNPENKLNVILLGMHGLIGETSNCATTYHNKMPQTLEQKKKYEKYIDTLSTINGKAIDAAKHGVLIKIPMHIAKYGKPVPYFMKYAKPYYAKQKKHLKSQSNMNRLCWEVEKWHKAMRWERRDKGFDYRIMINESIVVDEEIFTEIEKVFHEYNREFSKCKSDEHSIKREYGDFKYCWDEFYDNFRAKCNAICPNKAMFVNIAATICYEKFPKRSKGFLWHLAGEALVDNIKQVEVQLPLRDEVNGKCEYIGKKYSLVSPTETDGVKVNAVDELADFWEEN